MTRRCALWMFTGFCVVLAATLVPRIGVSLLAALASLLVGAAASLWLGDAARNTAATAARASAIVGIGAFCATVVAFPGAHITLLGTWGTLFVGIGVGLINLGLSVLGGTLAWLAVGEPLEQIRDEPLPLRS